MTSVLNSVGHIVFTIKHENEEPTLEELLEGWSQRLKDFRDASELNDALLNAGCDDTYEEGKW